MFLGHPFTLFIWTFIEITESSFFASFLDLCHHIVGALNTQLQRGLKVGKNTEREAVACPRFCMFWVFCMVVKHEWHSVKGHLHSVVIPASRK